MKGWILYCKKEQDLCEKQDYEILRLLKAAKARNIKLCIYTPAQFDIIPHRDQDSMLIDGTPESLPNFAFSYLGATASYFSLAILAELERCGVHTGNPVAAIKRAVDKFGMRQLLVTHNIPSPRTMLLKSPIDMRVVKQEIGFPLVVKDINSMGGKGIYLSENEENLRDLLGLVSLSSCQRNLLLQEFMKSSRGRDIRVFVIDGKVIGCMVRHSTTSFKANYSFGGTVEPFQITPPLKELALKVAKLSELAITGIDLLFGEKDGTYTVCEVNSSPGFRGLEKLIGPVVAEHIIESLIP